VKNGDHRETESDRIDKVTQGRTL